MTSIRTLLTYTNRYKREVILSSLCNILMVVFSVVSIPTLIPFFKLLFQSDIAPVPAPDWSSSGFDKYVLYIKHEFYLFIQAYGTASALTYVCITIVIIFFLKNLFRFLALYFVAPVRTGIVRDIRSQLYDKFHELPLSFYSEKKKGDLIARITADVQEIESSILNVIETLVKEPLMIVGCLTYMLFISPSLTGIVFLMVLVMGGIIGTIGSKLKKSSSKAQDILGNMVAIIEETLSGMKIIQGFNAQNFRRNTFNNTNEAYRNTLIPVFRRRDLSSPLSEFLGIGVVAILLIIGSRYVFSGKVEPEVFLSFLFAFYSVINPAKSFSKAYFNVQKGLAAADRVKHILEQSNPIQEATEPITIQALQQNILFQNVTYAYETDRPVLENINLNIPEGSVVALVGASGSGKTTLTDLLTRFYDVNKGTILIDGQNIKKYDLSSLRSLFGLVSQKPILFHDTIYNNIVFGRKNITQAQVEQAAKIANAHDFILETSDAYQTIIGDGGNKLSGGQQQRLTIARAILENPSILILDEATSALDSQSEQAVQKALAAAAQNRTVIIIAHRLSTISHADKIIVLEKGKIVEQGTHNELLLNKYVYFNLVHLQSL